MKTSKKEKARLAPFDAPRSEELLMSDDAYISRFGTDRELAELRAKIEARRFPAASKKGMKTAEEVRARLADFEARFEAKVKAIPGREVRADRALELEMLGSWIGALKWILGEGVKRKDT